MNRAAHLDASAPVLATALDLDAHGSIDGGAMPRAAGDARGSALDLDALGALHAGDAAPGVGSGPHPRATLAETAVDVVPESVFDQPTVPYAWPLLFLARGVA